MGSVIVLDTWALMALIEEEDAAERVETAWGQGTVPAMCSVNLGEVLYQEERRHGRGPALRAVDEARDALLVIDPDWELVVAAAGRKAQGGLSYADCFALATAERLGADLWTGDPEIIAAPSGVTVVDLR